MPLYQKKPVTVEARLFGKNRENIDELIQWMDGAGEKVRTEKHEQTQFHIHIHTLEGTMIADPGDYIIKGVKGEFYPCKPEIFHETYREVHNA